MFLQPNDYMIIMNNPRHQTWPGKGNPLQDDELRRLRDAGATVILNYVFWNEVAKNGWGYVDEHVNQTQKMGVKCVLSTYNDPEPNLHADCYAGTGAGYNRQILSMWSPLAREELTKFYEEVLSRYGGSDVLVVQQNYFTGESAYHNAPHFSDKYAVESHMERFGRKPNISTPETREWLQDGVIDFFTYIDGLLVGQHNEIWNDLQWLIAQQSKANGNFAQDALLAKEQELWPDAQRVLLQYTYFAHPEPYPTIIQDWKERYGLHVIIESQHCGGLVHSTPAAIELGFQGQICGVLHYWGDSKGRVSQKEVDLISDSVQKWEAANPTLAPVSLKGKDIKIERFLDQDEKLIVVSNTHLPLSKEDFAAMAGAGVKTTMLLGAASWHLIQPREDGRLSWRQIDNQIKNAHAAGLKVLLPTYHRPPEWLKGIITTPDRDHWGLQGKIVDISNKAAMDQEEAFLRTMFKRYKDPNVQLIPSIPYDGEFVALATAQFIQEDIEAAVMRRLRLFADAGQGLWTMFHPAHKDLCNDHVPYDKITAEFALSHELNRVLWTFFTCAGCEAYLGPDCFRYWVGADYAARVVDAATRASQWGVWGLVMQPRPDRGPLEPWMIDATAKAVEILGGS